MVGNQLTRVRWGGIKTDTGVMKLKKKMVPARTSANVIRLSYSGKQNWLQATSENDKGAENLDGGKESRESTEEIEKKGVRQSRKSGRSDRNKTWGSASTTDKKDLIAEKVNLGKGLFPGSPRLQSNNLFRHILETLRPRSKGRPRKVGVTGELSDQCSPRGHLRRVSPLPYSHEGEGSVSRDGKTERGAEGKFRAGAVTRGVNTKKIGK